MYADEHFLAHKLLAEGNPNNDKLVNAYAMMAFTKNSNQDRIELTPEEYANVRVLFSNNMKKKWQNEEYREMQSEIIRKRWTNPKYREFQSKNRTKLNNEMWKNEDFKKRMSEKTKERWNGMSDDDKEESKLRMKEISDKMWKNIEYVKRHCTPVFCLETQEYFLCQQDAVKKYDISASGLSNCLSGRQKSAGKHKVTGEALHWRKATWEECQNNISNVCQSEKINLLGINASQE